MTSPAQDIASILATGGAGALAGTSEWAIFSAVEPTDPDSTITVYDTGGLDPDTDDLSPTRPTFQVRVRATDYAAAYAKQTEIRDLLIETERHVVGGSVTFGIKMQSGILALGRDDNGRHLLTANYSALRTEGV